MNAQQKAVIEKAKKDGLQPSEIASEFLLHDIVQACIGQLSKHEVGFRKLTEKQQDASIAELTDNLKESALLAARIIASAGTPTVSGTLKKIAIDTKSVLTVTVDGSEKYFNELISKTQDRSDVLIVLYERDYFDAMDNIQSDKDQKSLPLDSAEPEKPAGKGKAKPAGKAKSAADVAAAIAFKPEQLDKAIAFVTEHRTPTTAGIQNILSVGYEKAEAILAELARQGVVVAQEDGKYAMPSLPGTTDAAAEPVAEGASKLTEELYEKMKAKTIKDQVVSAGGLAVAFDTTIPVADDAIERLELEGVISEEDEFSQRTVFDQE